MKYSQISVSRNLLALFCGRATLAMAMAAVLIPLMAPKSADAAPTRSTTIALTSDETRLVVVNREANSVSIIRVKNINGGDVSNKIAEIPVGEEPRCVAIHPSNRAAYVTNAISGTISVVNLNQLRVVSELDVGTEPRGCALTADGSLLYVANPKAQYRSSTPAFRCDRPSVRPRCKLAADPGPSQSRIKGPARSPTTPFLLLRSSPNSIPTSKIRCLTAMARRATSGNKVSSMPFRPATAIRRSPKSP